MPKKLKIPHLNVTTICTYPRYKGKLILLPPTIFKQLQEVGCKTHLKPMYQGDYKNIENVDIPLNNKPILKQCCVYLLRQLVENTKKGDKYEQGKKYNLHCLMPCTNHRNRSKKRIKLLMLQIMYIMEEMRRGKKIQYHAMHSQTFKELKVIS